MRNLFGNLRYALRQFAHAPVFTAAAVLTLALGIGGTTAIFSLIDTVMLRSLPVVDPGRLYRVGEGNECCVEGGPQNPWGLFSFPLYERMKQNLPEFEEITAFQARPGVMSVRRESERVGKPLTTEFVTGSYFSTFGIRAFGGRLFSAADDQPSAAPVVVMSYHAWRQSYGGDPKVVGSSYAIEGHPFTVVGIAPPGFFGETLRGDPPDMWIPLQQEPVIRGSGSLLHQPVSAWLRIIGRLRPGATIAGISPRLTTILRHWLQYDSGYPAEWMPGVLRELPHESINIVPAGAGVAEMKEEYGRSLTILLAACYLVLLIACANVANLLLARAAARRSQTAVRVAIGASQRQIVGQALLESILLAVMGGVAGLAVAVGASRLLLVLAFHGTSYLPIGTLPSLPVLGFAFALSLLTGVIFGTAPAWFATHTQPVEALRSATRSTRDRSSLTRHGLLIVQATLSVVLVAGAAMLARSLGNLENQNFGFQTANRVMVQLNPPPTSYTPERLNALYAEMEQRLQRLPGVEQAGLALYNPFTNNWGESIVVEGKPPSLSEHTGSSWVRVSANYLQVLGMRIVRGRNFSRADNQDTAPVAIVNQAFVKRFFPNEDPLDKHFGMDERAYAGTFRIVGVVEDGKYAFPREAVQPLFFVPLAQYVHYNDKMMQMLDQMSHLISGIALVTHTPVGVLQPLVARTLADLDPNLTVISMQTLDDAVATEFDQERAVASLAGLFGLVALVLAAVGLYGVTTYTVAQRTGEIGVRMALGADRLRVVQLVLQGAFRRVLLGLLLGIPLAIGAGRLMASQLWGVKVWDPPALTVATAALAVCALLAAIIPALRAAAIHPMEALRAE